LNLIKIKYSFLSHSQQTDFSGGNSALMPSSRFVGQSQSVPQMADSGSNGGW
jgi:hypothetical protein